MLIVLEGLDGAGKSTQVKKLKEYLTERCGELVYIHFPRYDAPVYGDLIGRFLQGEFGAIDAVHPQLVALLFAEDRHGAAPMMREALEAGKVVLLDRYVYSNIAYQGAKLPAGPERRKLRDWIFDTEFGEFNLPEPDLNLFLDVPIGFVEKSLAAHREGDDRSYLHGSQDIHEADIRFQEAVRDMYRSEAARDPHFIRIDCGDAEGRMLPPDDIFAKVRAAVDPYLA
jgi:dTMP kinase